MKFPPKEVVKIYKMHGLKITVKEAERILSFMDSMIQVVKEKFIENSPHWAYAST